MSQGTNPYEDLIQAWTRAMTAFLPGARGVASGEADGDEPADPMDPMEMMNRMTDAHLATVQSGLRYMRRWAELSGKAYPLAIRAMRGSGSGAGEDTGALMDELRGTLREMAELPLKESNRLQSELTDVWKMKTAEPAPGEDDAPKRRARRTRIKE